MTGHIQANGEQARELQKMLASEGVEYCYASYVDVHGVSKAKCVPVSTSLT